MMSLALLPGRPAAAGRRGATAAARPVPARTPFAPAPRAPLAPARRRLHVPRATPDGPGPEEQRKDPLDEGDEGTISRGEIIRGTLFIGAGAYIASDLVQDLGYSVGENAEAVPEYEGVQGVGTKYKLATFAGGCFWCMEPAFDDVGEGVVATISGYTGGFKRDPSYREVSSGRTGHVEAVQVVYDPTVVSYDQLLDAFWHNVDPTQADGQFVDIGPQYTTAIFYYDAEQRAEAEASKRALDASGVLGGRPVVTTIRKAETFWPAELYHQNYYVKSAPRYRIYRSLSGRDDFIASTYGKEYVHPH